MTALIDAINAHAAALETRNNIISEIARMRIAGETISPEFIAEADAAFTSEVEAANARNAVITEAKAAGVPEAQNMHIPAQRGADILAMEYKPIQRVGGQLVF